MALFYQQESLFMYINSDCYDGKLNLAYQQSLDVWPWCPASARCECGHASRVITPRSRYCIYRRYLCSGLLWMAQKSGVAIQPQLNFSLYARIDWLRSISTSVRDTVVKLRCTCLSTNRKISTSPLCIRNRISMPRVDFHGLQNYWVMGFVSWT